MILNRMAASRLGRYFTDIEGNEYVGLVPFAIIGFVAAIVAIVWSIVVLSWLPIFWWLGYALAVGGFAGLLNLTAAASDDKLADAIRDYNALSREERRQLPAKLDRTLVRENNSSLTYEAQRTIDSIVEHRRALAAPVYQEMIRDLRHTRTALDSSTQKQKELA